MKVTFEQPYPSCVRTRSSRPKYLCLSSSTKVLCLWTGSSRPRMASASLILISCSARFSWTRNASWFWSWGDAHSGEWDIRRPELADQHILTHTNLIKRRKRSCLQLSHLMELHPEVRNILPELQEIDFKRNWALGWWGCTTLGSQYWGTTWTRVKNQVRACYLKNVTLIMHKTGFCSFICACWNLKNVLKTSYFIIALVIALK